MAPPPHFSRRSIKIAVMVAVSVRRMHVRLASAFPHKGVFATALERLVT